MEKSNTEILKKKTKYKWLSGTALLTVHTQDWKSYEGFGGDGKVHSYITLCLKAGTEYDIFQNSCD